MNREKTILRQRQRRQFRVRRRILGTSERPRLSVFRSHKHIYAQLIDDVQGKTLLAASTQDTQLPAEVKYGGNTAAAVQVGKAVAERALAAGITRVALDRGPYKYHGRVSALANAAREAGLEF